jgi:uncharacterized cupredoxin-like copper-binding protein
MRTQLLVLIIVAGLAAFACGGDDDSGAEGARDGMNMEDEGAFAFGEPSDAAGADREIEVVATDNYSYEPPIIEIAQGESVTFVVTNEGKIAHEFVLGDEDLQDEHEEEMAEMGGQMMEEEPNAISIQPGDTRELTWTFTKAGEVLYACHELDPESHYEAGMIGTITVE